MKHSREVSEGDDPSLEEFLPGLRPPLEAHFSISRTRSRITRRIWTMHFPSSLITDGRDLGKCAISRARLDEAERCFPAQPQRFAIP